MATVCRPAPSAKKRNTSTVGRKRVKPADSFMKYPPMLKDNAAKQVNVVNIGIPPRNNPLSVLLQANGPQGSKSVEAHRGIAAGIGAGIQDLDTVAALEVEWHVVAGLLVENVGAVTGRTGEHDRSRRSGTRRAQSILNALVERFGQAAEFPHVEIDPARLVGARLARDQHDFALDDTGLGDQGPARLKHQLWLRGPECVVQRLADRVGKPPNRGDAVLVGHREAASDVYGVKDDALTSQLAKQPDRFAQRVLPLRRIRLLRSHMKRDPDGLETKAPRHQQQV